ncbi:hypothetical protein Tco_1169308 [Tanacetum coccineum]
MRQRRWNKLLSDYHCELKYHPGKANIMADALSRKERLRPTSIRTSGMTAWIPKVNNPRRDVMDEAHRSRYSIYLGADKMYKDVKE